MDTPVLPDEESFAISEPIKDSEEPEEKEVEESETEDEPEEEPGEDVKPEEPEPEDSSPPDDHVAKGVQKRINELTRLRWEEKRRADALEAEIEKLKSASGTSKPNQDDFDTEEEFIEALADWKVEQALSKRQQEEAERNRQMQREQSQLAFQQKLTSASIKYDDINSLLYDERGEPRIVINDAAAEYLAESDAGEDVLYFLAKNPQEANRIAYMSPVNAGRELYRIEEGLKAHKATPTKAPEPIIPSKGKAKVTKDPSQMTDREFAEWRRKQIQNR